jgi:glycosidase
MFALSRRLGALCLALLPQAALPATDSRELPPHWQHGAFMEVFVRAYADSNGDGIGDLRGLTAKLDDLKALGISGLWLMPITASADHDHGYATTDHRAIEPAYGTLADLDELLRQARRRGIGVIVDYVVNHAAADHPAFVDARSKPDSPWRDWFVWSQTLPQGWDIWGKNPWYAVSAEPWTFQGELTTLQPAPGDPRGYYFATFGPAMPDFNLRNPAVVDYHLDSLRFWLDRGLGGFRLDAAPHLIENSATDWNDQPESRALTLRLQQLIKSYPGRHVVCEATASPQAWADPAVCGGAFAFGYTQHFVGAARGDAESVRQLAAYYRSARPTLATFVSNHDIFAGQRLWDQVQGDETRYKLAAAAYLLQPGTPFIYYGEEVGQAGIPGLPGDQPLRGPMSWTSDPRGAGFSTKTPFRAVAPNVATHNARSQRSDPRSIWHFYRALIALRNIRPSIARGGFEHSFADGLVLGFQRTLDDDRVLVLLNYGTQPVVVDVPGLQATARGRALYPAGAAPLRGARIALPSQSLRVYSLR